jgi:hypothetical protein
MPAPQDFLNFRCEINPAFLPLSDTDREGVAGVLTDLATLLLARACEIREKKEPSGVALEVAWPTIR